MASEADRYKPGEINIIVAPDDSLQEKISGDLFAIMLDMHGYRIKKTAYSGGKALILTENPAGAAVSFMIDPVVCEIQILHAIPLKYWVSVRDRSLADKLIDLGPETRRVSILLDRDAREVVLIAAIDLLGNPPFEELVELIGRRWTEMEEIRNSGLNEFIDAPAPIRGTAAI